MDGMSHPTPFRESYAVLKTVADRLKSAQEPDVDELVPLVQQALAAHEACKARLEAIELALAALTPGDAS